MVNGFSITSLLRYPCLETGFCYYKDVKKTQNALGIAAGLFSALTVSAYLTVNRYIYTHYDIGAFEYSLLFAVTGGLFGLVSLGRSFDRAAYHAVRQNIRSLLLLGLIGCTAVGAFIFGLGYTSTVNAALLVTSTIVTTSFFSYLLLGEHLAKRQWRWVVVLFIGLYIGIVGLSSFELQKGDLIVLGAALFFGLGNAYSRSVMRRMERPGIVPDMRIVIGGLIALAVGGTVTRDYAVVVDVLPLALVAGLFYWLCMKSFAHSVHLISANEAIVLNNSQIFFTSLAGVFILSEEYSLEKFIGSLIVIISVYFIAAHKKWKTPAPSP